MLLDASNAVGGDYSSISVGDGVSSLINVHVLVPTTKEKVDNIGAYWHDPLFQEGGLSEQLRAFGSSWHEHLTSLLPLCQRRMEWASKGVLDHWQDFIAAAEPYEERDSIIFQRNRLEPGIVTLLSCSRLQTSMTMDLQKKKWRRRVRGGRWHHGREDGD